MTDIRDAICPGNDLTLWRARRGTRPGVVADAVKNLRGQIERLEYDICAEDSMVIASFEKGAKSILARMSARAMATVMAECDRLDERDVQPQRLSNSSSNLCDLKCMGQS